MRFRSSGSAIRTGAIRGIPIASTGRMPTQPSSNDRPSNDRPTRKRKRLGATGAGQRAVRFPVKLPVRYKVGGELGWGELVNISSSGALFTTERTLPLGKRVELWINWPALLLEA